jgi:hypothetical protein
MMCPWLRASIPLVFFFVWISFPFTSSALPEVRRFSRLAQIPRWKDAKTMREAPGTAHPKNSEFSQLMQRASLEDVNPLPEKDRTIHHDNSEFSQLAQRVTWKDAHTMWVTRRIAHPLYFDATWDNIKSTGAAVWLEQEMQRIHKENPHYRAGNLTEPEIFGREKIGNTDFDCDLLKGTCGGDVTPSSIITYLNASHPEWSPKLLMEQAQLTRLSLKFMDIFTLIMSKNYAVSRFLHPTYCFPCLISHSISSVLSKQRKVSSAAQSSNISQYRRIIDPSKNVN